VSEIDPLDDPSAVSIGSSSDSEGGISDVDMGDHPSQHSAGATLKRKREQMEFDMSQHRRISYSDELLDYFMTKDMDAPEFLLFPSSGF
jgi:transcription factor MBP1